MVNSKYTKSLPTLGSLCSDLAKANVMIYHYENQNWWAIRGKKISNKKIAKWDMLSREWNEKRSKIKNEIDKLLSSQFNKRGHVNKPTQDLNFPFQILPISLMIDMLTIENIKIYDLKKKKNIEGIRRATAKKRALIEEIDKCLNIILKAGKYEPTPEARTF